MFSFLKQKKGPDKPILYRAYKSRLEKQEVIRKGVVITILRMADIQAFHETTQTILDYLEEVSGGRIGIYTVYPSQEKYNVGSCFRLDSLKETKKENDLNIVILDQFDEQVQRDARLNIVLTMGGGQYLQKIGQLTNKAVLRKKKKDWKFIFSVQEEKKKEIRLMMEDFGVYFTPLEKGGLKWIGKKLSGCW